MSAPVFSIVTVCFNARATLPEARASLAAQRFGDYEWIVVDGASTDGTAEWVRAQGVAATAFVSEKDAGIYDAMNKALGLAHGEWVFFLNADDRLADPMVLADVAQACATSQADLVYGDVMYTDGARSWPKSFAWLTPRKLVFGDLCHQVVFARRSLFQTYGMFDLSFKYNADFDWLLRVFKAGARAHYLKRTVSIFFHGGTHVKNAAACEAERFVVRHRFQNPLRWRLGNLMLRLELKVRRLRGEHV